MKCSTCGSDNPDRAKFCVECGGAFTARCKACNVELPAGAKFCLECGAKVAGAASSAPIPPPRETPKHLADKIRQSKAAVEGERKQVTVLFADVKGSMELAESLDPEAFSRIMSRFFAILTEGVERFEGFVDKFTGDGIMALFGAPIAHEDHAQRACYAALHLKDEIARYATELKREHGLSFSTRMGLNSGEVVVGNIGEDLRMDYTAQGHTVGLAQRMENLAEPNTCFVSANTASLVRGYFDLEDLGEFRVKGVAAPMHVHRLGSIGSSRTRLDVSRARGFSRFVGRGDEMHMLESALTRARQSNAQVIGIVGEAGLGKSRLSFEFLERCRAQNLMTYETTGVAHGKATPLVPILKLFRGFFGITDQDSAITARERIAGRLLLLDEKLRDNLALIFDFLGYPDPDNPAPKADPETRQRQMFDVVRRITQARSPKETQVMLLEDLHWFDGASAAFLEPLIEAAVGTRTLVILNFRPEFQAPWMGKSYYLQLPLGALGSDAIREMLDALLGKDQSTKGLAEAIHTRTSGNPFFTEEVVQNLIETGKLQGTKGAYKLVTPLERLDVPTAVHALLAARIDRLASREKDVLQAASVIGRAFDEPTLAAIVALEPPQLRESLQKLKSAEFVYEQSLYPVTEYLFKHPLTQEVALSSQLQEKRRKLHAAVAQVIEAAHTTDLDNHAALLAHHWDEAGHAVNSATWHRHAALHIAANNSVEAMRHWHSVRNWADKIADSALAVELAGEARVMVLEFVWRLGKAAEAEKIFQEAEAWALAHDSKLTLARLHNAYCLVVALGLGDLRRAVVICEAGLRYASEIDDPPTSFMLKLRSGFIMSYMGNVRPAREAIEAANAFPLAVKEAASDFVSFDVPAYALGHLAAVVSHQGRLTESLALLGQSLDRARRLGAVEPLGWLLGFEAEILSYCGDFERAATSARASMEIGQRREDPFTITWALSDLSRLSLQDGSLDTAMAQAEQGLDGARLYFKFWIPWNMCTLAMVQLARGQREAAYNLALEALRIADAQAFYWGGPHPQMALARIKLAEESSSGQSEAVGWLDQAERVANETGTLVQLPQILELRAALAHQQGDEAAYETVRREALRLYREMGATGHAERLAKELAS